MEVPNGVFKLQWADIYLNPSAFVSESQRLVHFTVSKIDSLLLKIKFTAEQAVNAYRGSTDIPLLFP